MARAKSAKVVFHRLHAKGISMNKNRYFYVFFMSVNFFHHIAPNAETRTRSDSNYAVIQPKPALMADQLAQSLSPHSQFNSMLDAIEQSGTCGDHTLESAVKSDLPELITTLLNRGDDACLYNIHGFTPLMLACQKGSKKSVEALLKARQNVINQVSLNGNNALLWLLASPADFDAIENITVQLITKGIDLNHKNKEEETALSKLFKRKMNESEQKKLVPFVSWLLSLKKINLAIVDKHKNNPLLIALSHDLPVTVKLELISLFASYNIDLNYQNSEGETALIKLLKIKSTSDEQKLISACLTPLVKSKKLSLDLADNTRTTPLMWACKNKNMLAVSFLLHFNAEVYAKNNLGESFHKFMAESDELSKLWFGNYFTIYRRIEERNEKIKKMATELMPQLVPEFSQYTKSTNYHSPRKTITDIIAGYINDADEIQIFESQSRSRQESGYSQIDLDADHDSDDLNVTVSICVNQETADLRHLSTHDKNETLQRVRPSFDIVLDALNTVFCESTQTNSDGISTDLLNKRVSTTTQVDEKLTPFLRACKYGKKNAIIALLKAQKNCIYQVSSNGNNALLWIFSSGTDMQNRLEAAQVLIEHEININHQNNNGETAIIKLLQLPLSADEQKLITSFLTRLIAHKKINIELADNSGTTPLIYACKKHNIQAVQLLLHYNAEIHSKNSLGESFFTLFQTNEEIKKLWFEHYFQIYRGIKDRNENIKRMASEILPKLVPDFAQNFIHKNYLGPRKTVLDLITGYIA